MSLKYAEAFEDGNWDTRATASLASNVDAAYGKSGKGARVGDITNTYIYLPVKTGNAVRHIVGFHVFIATGGTGILAYWSTSDKGVIRFDNLNQRLSYRYSPNTVSEIDLWTPNGSFKAGQWHYVEFDFAPGTSSNSVFKIYIDGVLELNTSGQDCYSTYTINNFRIGGTGSADIDAVYIDDIYYVDPTDDIYPTEPLGPVDMGSAFPSGNGNSSDLVGQDANSVDNYQNVDEVDPDDGTTYNGSGTDGDTDTYDMDSLSGDADVVGMVVSLNAIKTDVGVKYIKPVVRTKTANDYTTTPTLTASTTDTTFAAGNAWRVAASFWKSTAVSTTEWWKADFGSAKDMGYVSIDITAGGSTYPTEMELQYSDNDSDWFAAGNKVIGVSAGTWILNADLTDTSHRYWRIVFSEFSGTAGMEADNIYFYEVSATLGDHVGDSLGLSESYDVYDVSYMANPTTGKALNITDINAMEIGAAVSDT